MGTVGTGDTSIANRPLPYARTARKKTRRPEHEVRLTCAAGELKIHYLRDHVAFDEWEVVQQPRFERDDHRKDIPALTENYVGQMTHASRSKKPSDDIPIRQHLNGSPYGR